MQLWHAGIAARIRCWLCCCCSGSSCCHSPWGLIAQGSCGRVEDVLLTLLLLLMLLQLLLQLLMLQVVGLQDWGIIRPMLLTLLCCRCSVHCIAVVAVGVVVEAGVCMQSHHVAGLIHTRPAQQGQQKQ